MGELARRTGTSLSRAWHAVGALEGRGWVECCPAPEDRRGRVARLTDDRRALLERIAAGHVAEVRRRVFDSLSTDDVEHLRRLMEKVFADLPG